MRVAFVSQNVSPGLLIFRKYLIKDLVAKGHTVFAFAVDYTESSKREIESLGAIPVSYRLSKTGLNPLEDCRDVMALRRQFKEIHLDVVFSFFVKPSIYGTFAAKLARVPRRIAMLEGLGYIHTQSSRGYGLKKRLLQIAHGVLSTVGYFFAHSVFFLNPDDPRDLSKISFLRQSKLKMIGPIGLDLNDYPFTPVVVNGPVRFIFVARLLAEKGVFEYIEAARSIKKDYPSTEFVILGGLDPDNPAALTTDQLKLIIDEGLVIYPGHVRNVHEWMSSSHVFVLPSYREGFPRSTQEAMAIGRAVITTDVPGCRETVINGINGFIVPPWQSEALAEKMRYFIEKPQEIKRMGMESHRIAVERFDVHKINSDFVDILLGKA